MGKTKITIICENTAGRLVGITGEHGFAALIEKNGEKILLDTGQGMTLKNNADTLMIDLAQVKKIVLSHGHYDHTGGLPHALFPPRGVEVIAHPDIFDAKYSEVPLQNEIKHFFIGTKFRRDYLETTLGANFSLKTKYCEISPGIFFSGEVPRVTEFEHPDTHLKIKKKDAFMVDPLKDDASLMIETDSGPVILTGCAHTGIVNVMKHFQKKSGHDAFHAVIGGTHLGFMGVGEQLEKSMDAFDEFKVNLIAVSHCTGNEAAAICYNRFQDRFAFANAGWTIDF